MSSKNKSESDDAGASAVPGFDPKPVNVGGESLVERIVPHVKKIVLVIVGVSVVVSIFFTYRWWTHRKSVKATTALAQAIGAAQLRIEPPAEDGAAPAPEPGPDDPPKPVTYPSAAARAEEVLGKLAKTEGSPRDGAALLEAAMLFDAGRLDDAERRYRSLAGRRGIEGAAARESLGFIAEARADAATDPAERTRQLEAALTAFRAMQPDDAGLRRAWALYHEGRLLAALGKRDEARVALQAALDKADPDLHDTVEMRLTQLDAVAATP